MRAREYVPLLRHFFKNSVHPNQRFDAFACGVRPKLDRSDMRLVVLAACCLLPLGFATTSGICTLQEMMREVALLAREKPTLLPDDVVHAIVTRNKVSVVSVADSSFASV